MESKVTPRDQMIYNFASAPFGVSDETSLDVLSRLSKKYPCSDTIRRSFAKKLRETCRFKAAVEEYFWLFMSSRREEDIVGLLICSLHTRSFDLYFLDMKLHRMIGQTQPTPGNGNCLPTLEKVIAIFESKVFEVDHERYIGECPIGTSMEEGVDYCDAFHGLYTKCILLVQKRKCAEAFDMLMEMFKTTSIHETVEFLVQSERVELLYHLSQQFLFFEKYYKAAQVAINEKLLNVFWLVVESRSGDLVSEFCEILKHRNQESSLFCRESSF